MLWKIELRGDRTSEPRLKNGYLWLEIEAATKDEAEEVARDSMPGFDWRFTTNYGAVEVEE